MTIAPHALIGAASSTFTSNIWLAFLFGVISHFIGDAVPHLEPNSLVTKTSTGEKKWAPGLYVYVAAEILFTIWLISFVRHRPDFYLIVAGVIGGLLPDMIVNNPFLQKYHDKPVIKYIFIFHDKIHMELPISLWYISALTELSLIILSLWLLFR
jgi:hypothetical protein